MRTILNVLFGIIIRPTDDKKSQQLCKRVAILVWAPNLVLLVLLLNTAALVAKDLKLADVGVLDAGATVTAIVAVGALIVGRFHLEKSARPRIGYFDEPAEKSPLSNTSFLHNSPDAREMHFYNGGQGHGVLSSIHYKIRLEDREIDSRQQWMSGDDARSLLESGGLKYGQDFDLPSLGAGLPLPPTTAPKEQGYLFLAVSRKAILGIAGVDVRILVTDVLGNTYQIMMRVVQSHNQSLVGDLPVYKRILISRLAAESQGQIQPDLPE